MNGVSAGRRFHILLVEDNSADIYLFREAIRDAGLSVELTVITDGAAGIRYAQRRGEYADNVAVPDIAVLDMNLPKAGGDSVLRAMREKKELERVPVLIMTSISGPQEWAMGLGVERFIVKPMDWGAAMRIGSVVKEVLLKTLAESGLKSHTATEGS